MVKIESGIESAAIIGYGDFGQLLARLLPETLQIMVTDPRLDCTIEPNAYVASIEEAAKADLVIIATPYDAMPRALKELAAHVLEDSIVMDVTSVKVKPAEQLQKQLFGKSHFVATHPLFGPNSAPDRAAAKGKQMVWSTLEGGGDVSVAKTLFEDELGLEIVEMTPDEHDRQMAWIQGLTFFVGRALGEMKIPNFDISTGYFQELLDLVRLDAGQSNDLFKTVQEHNPYVVKMRRQFLEIAQQIHEEH